MQPTNEPTNNYGGTPDDTPKVVTWIKRMESARVLDVPARLLQGLAAVLTASPARRDALLGMPAGHALHPVLTDLPIGFWTSATVLDLVGGKQSRPAATRLLALGLLAAVPTSVTGLAEFEATGQREKRVGVLHVAANSVALACYASSLRARRKDRHTRGVLLALAGSSATGVSGYLGGHLTSVRKVSSRHPGFGL